MVSSTRVAKVWRSYKAVDNDNVKQLDLCNKAYYSFIGTRNKGKCWSNLSWKFLIYLNINNNIPSLYCTYFSKIEQYLQHTKKDVGTLLSLRNLLIKSPLHWCSSGKMLCFYDVVFCIEHLIYEEINVRVILSLEERSLPENLWVQNTMWVIKAA